MFQTVSRLLPEVPLILVTPIATYSVMSFAKTLALQARHAEEKTAGGIIIPDTAKEKPSQGEVIAIGPDGRDENGQKEGRLRLPIHI